MTMDKESKAVTDVVELPLGTDHGVARQRSSIWSFKGGRVTVLAGAAIAALALIANVGVLIWAATRYTLVGGVATVFTGSCQTMRTAMLWSHLGINILSSLLLAAGNNCMQCLTAPTRADVDRAHGSRKWLDIGPHSLRNLTSIGSSRLLLWVCLALSSVPLHLL